MRELSLGKLVDGVLARHPRALMIAGAMVALLGIAMAAVGEESLSLMFALVAAVAAALLYLAGQDVMLTAIIVVVVIFVDFYELFGLPLREPVVGIALSGLLLAALFLTQTRAQPWSRIPGIWFWAILLALAGLAIPRGAITATAFYFLTVFIGPMLLYIVGVQVGRTPDRLRWLMALVSAVAVFVALHSIVQGVTGVFLFATQRQTDYLGSVSGFHLAGLTIDRAGSFLENPDWNGAYLAFSFFPLAGLALSARAMWTRILCLAGAALILIALLFTFTTASWLSLGVGLVVMFWRVVPRRYLKRSLIALAVVTMAMAAVFNYQIRLLFLHATTNRELTLRLGAWWTALRVIWAHPLTGIGMSQNIYVVKAEPYRVAWQTRPLAHPHNSYLELAAFAGLPVLLAFLALLGATLLTITRRWRQAPVAIQPVIGAVFTALIVFSVNSLAINGWTLAPLAGIAWLLAGAVAGRFRSARHAEDFEGLVSGVPERSHATAER
jgi:hypothetical protein